MIRRWCIDLWYAFCYKIGRLDLIPEEVLVGPRPIRSLSTGEIIGKGEAVMSERFTHCGDDELDCLIEKMNQVGDEYRVVTVLEKPIADAGPRYTAIFERVESRELTKVDESGNN